MRSGEGSSEKARNTLRMCKLDLTDSHFCRTVLNLRGSTTRFLFTIFRCELHVSSGWSVLSAESIKGTQWTAFMYV